MVVEITQEKKSTNFKLFSIQENSIKKFKDWY